MFPIFLHSITSFYLLQSSPQTLFFLHVVYVFLFSSYSSLFIFYIYLSLLSCNILPFLNFATFVIIHSSFLCLFCHQSSADARKYFIPDKKRKKSLISTGLSIMETCTLFKPPAKRRSVKRHRNVVLKSLSPSSMHLSVQIFPTSVAEDSLLCRMETLHCLEHRYSITRWRSL
jgi:hypothetical protein